MLGWMIVFLVVGIVIGQSGYVQLHQRLRKSRCHAEARPHLPHCRYHVHTEGD